MKDHTQNSSSQDSTPSNKHSLKRLYVVTGKGGVGKTTIAMALVKYLEGQGQRVLYNCFGQALDHALCGKLDIQSFSPTLEESAELYIGKKLGSKIIASWIMKTPFFNSLFNILPGLGNMIHFGHVVSLLQNDPTLTLVMDSPSSGHAITMFEASHNFKEIFNTGLIVKDIEEMHAFIAAKNGLEVLVCGLPTLMATHEALEMKETLQEMKINNVNIIMNDSLNAIPGITREGMPDFMQKKMDIELSVQKEYAGNIKASLPHQMSLEQYQIINGLVPNIAGVL